MILRSAQVRDYKSVTDSGVVRIEEDVTCLVGKNESGKTAFLEALYRLNPISTGHPTTFRGLRDYPRSRWSREKASADDVHPITAHFELDEGEISMVEGALGKGVLRNATITVSKRYDNRRIWWLDLNERAAIDHLVKRFDVQPGVAEGCTTIEGLRQKLEGQPRRAAATEELLAAVSELDLNKSARELLLPHLPKFLYFDEYNELPGTVPIAQLGGDPDELPPELRTALSLLHLADTEPGEFTEAEYESRRAELEAASSAITQEVFEYWSQNRDLRVFFDVDFRPPEIAGNPAEPYLEIRIENRRHFITLNFGERSANFVWFFSFLAAFSEHRDSDHPIVLLLDEPGLGLHASAQNDLLRYIDEQLATKRQVIYTTHSPFMVDPMKLDRARTVEDRDGKGTTISEEVLESSRETLFPLQASLGYELAQTLFVGPDNLVVEGPSDYLYLSILSEHLRTEGRESLDPRWTIVPVGGIDKIPTFIALLGAHLNVAVILDSAAGGSQKVNSMIAKGVIESKAVVPLASITATKEADIEDMFEVSWYLNLVRSSGAATITKAKLARGDRIVHQIEGAVGAFDHYQPAAYLLREQNKLLPSVPSESLDRFEELFKRANALLS